MNSFTIAIPAFPPSANHMYRPNGRNGGRVYSPELVAFFNVAALAWRQAGRPTLDETSRRYRVTLVFAAPNNRWYDLDNRVKPTLDALTKAGAWRDDRYFIDIRAIKGAPFPGGGVHVFAETLPEPEPQTPPKRKTANHGKQKT